MTFWPESPCSPCVPLRPLKHTCSLNPDILPEYTDPDLEFNYVDIGNVALEAGIIDCMRMTFANAPSRARKLVKPGDIIVSTVRTYLKAVACIPEDAERLVVSTGFAVLRVKPGADPRFLYRLVQSNPFVEAIVAASTGVSYPAINPSTLGDISVPLPDLPTQKAIADFLDRETARIDQLIEKKQRMVEVLGERLCAEREALVWVHSKFAKLGHHVSILSGYPFPSDGFSDDPLDARLLRGANVGVDTLRWDDVVYWPADDCERLKRFSLKIGDLVMGMDRPWISGGMRVATVGPDDVPSFLLQRVCKIKPRATMNGMFLKELLHSRHFLAHFEPILTGVSVPHISPDQIASFRFPYIDPDVQASQMEHFAKLVHWVRRVIYRTKTSIDRLREYRSALITAAVTGQIDVSTWGKQGTTDRRLDQIEETASA